MRNLTLIFLVFLLLSLSCKQKNNKTNYNDIEIPDTTNISKQTITKVFFNLPSPIELTQIVLSSEHYFNSDLLNNPNNISKYITSTQKALNFGVYGADLCYCRVYEKLQESINYLATIRQIADNLQIPESEGSKTIDRVETNLQNRDSVFKIIADTYAEANGYLKENERDETATYILIGGWIEGMFFATKIAEENHSNDEIIKRIAEQKFSLENIMLLINNYYDNEIIKKLIPNLKGLNKIYDNITISYKKPVIVTDKEDTVTNINNTTNINITKEQVKHISKLIENMRLIIIE